MIGIICTIKYNKILYGFVMLINIFTKCTFHRQNLCKDQMDVIIWQHKIEDV